MCKTETVTKQWLQKQWLPRNQWARVWQLPPTPSTGYFVSTCVFHQLTSPFTLMTWLLSARTHLQHNNSYFHHEMKHRRINSYFLPHNLHLIQLGNKHNIKDILDNWIHTLLDESSIEVPSTSSQSKKFLKINNSSWPLIFKMSKPLHIPRPDPDIDQDLRLRRIQLLNQLRDLLNDYYRLLQGVSHWLRFHIFLSIFVSIIAFHFFSSWTIYSEREITTS